MDNSILSIIISVGSGILLLSASGFIFGIGLAFVARIFQVEVDSRIEKIIEILPGLNCGACGYPGCSSYAEALIKNHAEINLCSPGGHEVMEKIGKLLNKEGEVKLKYVAKIFCIGDDAVSKKDYAFNGEDDCATVYELFNGDKSCKFGCVGRGNCIKVCPVNAIKRDVNNRVWIDANICIGCEKCVSICPSSVIKMIPVDGKYFVGCSNPEPGKVVRKICKRGCIACNICEKMAGSQRIQVINNLAVVKYDSDVDLQSAAVKCPSDVIVPIKNQSQFMKDSKNNKQETD